MKNIILKNILDDNCLNTLPSTVEEFKQLNCFTNNDIYTTLLLLDEYPKYGDMYMDCLQAIIQKCKISTNLLENLIDVFKKDLNNNVLSTQYYYLIIQCFIENGICIYHYMNEYFKIIDKCDDIFIRTNLSMTISQYTINYDMIEKYHHLINWRVFQENNDIYEILDDEDYYEIMESLITKDYFIKNLNYNDFINKCIEESHSLYDEIFIEMLKDYDKYHISYDTLWKYCQLKYVSTDLIEFICNDYQPNGRRWMYGEESKLLIILLQNNYMSDEQLRTILLEKNVSKFFKFESVREIIRKKFKFNFKIRLKLHNTRNKIIGRC